MYIINQFDSTHIKKHKFLIKDTLNQICETSHSFWYNKYEKALRNHLSDIKYILELQYVSFGTLIIEYYFLISIIFCNCI